MIYGVHVGLRYLVTSMTAQGIPTFVMGIVQIFCYNWIDCRGSSRTCSVVLLCNGLNIAENEM